MDIVLFTIIFAVVEFGGIFGFFFYKRYIKPIFCYKLVILDTDDEFTHVVKKGKAEVYGEYKGYLLFNETELYVIPLNKDEDKKLSKRDDYGMVTYYYHRNDTKPLDIDEKYFKNKDVNVSKHNPVDITNNENIPLSRQSKVLSSVTKTKVINSALLNEDNKQINWKLIIIIIGVVILVILFKDQIFGFIKGFTGG